MRPADGGRAEARNAGRGPRWGGLFGVSNEFVSGGGKMVDEVTLLWGESLRFKFN